jgi:hypothetical protein
MRDLSYRQAGACESAKHPKCRCRCGGRLHGAKRAGQAGKDWERVQDPHNPEEEVLIPPRSFFEALPADDPHRLPTVEEVKVLRPRWRRELKSAQSERASWRREKMRSAGGRALEGVPADIAWWDERIQRCTARIRELQELLEIELDPRQPEEPDPRPSPVAVLQDLVERAGGQVDPESFARAEAALEPGDRVLLPGQPGVFEVGEPIQLPAEPSVGDVWAFGRECMGNPAGTPAVCYEAYWLSGRQGWAFIFPNGSHDGFSPQDLELFRGRRRGHSTWAAEYRFASAVRLMADFRQGFFSHAFALYPDPERMAARVGDSPQL